MALCDICGQILKTDFALKRHLREIHSDTHFVVKCSYCQKPVKRTSDLIRHLKRVHKVDGETAREEVRQSEPITMSKRKFEDSGRPVYVPGLAEYYSDISSDEEMAVDEKPAETVPIATDNRVVQIAIDDDNVDRFSIDTRILDELVRESGESNEQYLENMLDEVMPDRSENTEACGGTENTNNANMSASASCAPITTDTGTDPCPPETRNQETLCRPNTTDVATDARDLPFEVTTTITMQFVRTTTLYPDGRTEIARTHNVTHSNNVQPTAQDYAELAEEIFHEVPRYLREGNTRYVYRD